MKIALFFRGAIRPNPQRVLENTRPLIQELRQAGHNVTTYLVTWPTYKGAGVDELINSNVYDNVIIEQEPTDEYIHQFITRTQPINGHTTIPNVWKTYYLSNKAIAQIVKQDAYDIIIHSRPDLLVKFGSHLANWLELADQAYVRPRCDAAWWICDVFGVASTNIMQRTWDYKTEQELGRRIDQISISEEVLMGLMKDNGIETLPCDLELFELDPSRHH